MSNSETREQVRARMQPLADVLSNAGFRAKLLEHDDHFEFCIRFREQTILGIPQFFTEETDDKGYLKRCTEEQAKKCRACKQVTDD